MAEPRVRSLYLLVLMFVEIFGNADFEDLQRRYNVVVNEMKEFKEAMKTMKEDIKRLGKVSHAVGKLCEEMGYVDLGGDPCLNCDCPLLAKTTEYGKYKTPIQLLSLQMKNNTFELEYSSPKQADVDMFHDMIQHSNLTQTFSKGKGVVGGRADWLYITLNISNYKAGLMFGKPKDTNPKLTLPSLNFSTSAQKEIFFQPGKSRILKVNMSKNESENFGYGFFTPSRDEPNTVYSMTPQWENFEDIVNQTEVKEYLHHKEITLVLNEKLEDYEGVLQLGVSTNILGRVFSSISVSQNLRVIRADHDKPFEDGYLGFIRFSADKTTDETFCKIGEHCMLSEKVMGDQPADITVWKLNNDGKEKLNLQNVQWKFGDSLEALFLMPNASKSDEGRYFFRATSHFGSEIDQQFEIRMYLPYTLSEDESQVLKDTPDELIVKCVGQGYPNPEIRFYNIDHPWESFRFNTGPGISIESKVDDDDVITATLTLDRRKSDIPFITCAVGSADDDDLNRYFIVYTKN